MKKTLLAIVAMVMAVSVQATVTVTKGAEDVVTIAVTGSAGQIGTTSFDYSQEIDANEQFLIKNAKHLVITGEINSTDIKTLVSKNQTGNNWTIPTLDMGKATISSIKVEGAGQWNITEHSFVPNNYTHIDATSVVLPVAKDGILPAYFGSCFTKETLKSVTIPEGYTSVGDYAFSQKNVLTTIDLPTGLTKIGRNAFDYTAINAITLPNSLKSIEDEAFLQCSNLKTITFPEGFERLGNHVFQRTILLDVYFLGKKAPEVGKEAFDDGSYHGNGGMKDTNYGNTLEEKFGDTNNGYAERRNYTYGANTMAVLHLRSDMTNEERAKYIDITRNYEVKKRDDNKYAAFYDMYYGEMKIWPGQYSYEHTYNNAKDGKLWDGQTPYDAEKYMGLHKFAIAISDINAPNTDTEKWEFSKITPEQWWTICVPFPMTKAQVREVFGENTEVCKLSEVVRDYDKHQITLKFKDDVYKSAQNDDATVIQDHISYMIFPTKTLGANEKYTFKGYHREPGSPEPTIVRATIQGAQTETEKTTVYNYRFIGTYLTKVDSKVDGGVGRPIYMPKYTYFLGKSGDKHKFFFQTGTTGTWNPYTATIQVFRENVRVGLNGINDSFVLTAGVKSASYFGLEDENTTGIDQIAIEAGSKEPVLTNVYNLNGQMVRKGATDFNDLPAGVYIVNGKKIVVR
ncbi:leucine-rich repeat domain-containing protein [Prevotella sp. HUN102]|uniref:leucine-rich repeat domain-containing protein n=1 Tax=Prevotella sp. HUN102 TaxID=1392486 RepID=UPI00048AABC0|nr:leucine-rich repeat domain-containing protein [Prevotella sp. HUN102]